MLQHPHTHGQLCNDILLVLQEARASEVAVHYTVSPAGAGYFVTGEANAHLPLQCDCCLATFRQPVTAPFKVLHHIAFAALEHECLCLTAQLSLPILSDVCKISSDSCSPCYTIEDYFY